MATNPFQDKMLQLLDQFQNGVRTLEQTTGVVEVIEAKQIITTTATQIIIITKMKQKQISKLENELYLIK